MVVIPTIAFAAALYLLVVGVLVPAAWITLFPAGVFSVLVPAACFAHLPAVVFGVLVPAAFALLP